MEFNGDLTSQLGVEKYLKGAKAAQFSNIDMFKTLRANANHWSECNVGCHHSSYRNVQRDITYNEFLGTLDKIDSLVTGALDGVVTTVNRLGYGVERTGEGLGLAGTQKFALVGDENYVAYSVVKEVFERLLSIDVNLLDNPVTRLVSTIVQEYMVALPEWVVDDLIAAGKLMLSEQIDV